MAEAVDAADMAGLHGKLCKLHRNLGDDFSMFSPCELIEDHTLKKMIQPTEICEYIGAFQTLTGFKGLMARPTTKEEQMVWMACPL